METRTSETPALPPPPRVIAALVNGFNTIAANVWVIVFPLVVDLFLWLGPRLAADPLFAPLVQALPEIQSQLPAGQMQEITQVFNQLQSGLNLFSVLRTFPLGIFSLMSVNISLISPLGERASLVFPSSLTTVGAILLLNFLGWVAGAIYFYTVSRVVFKQIPGSGMFRAVLQAVLLSIGWMIAFFIAYFFIVLGAMLVLMLNTAIRTLIFLLLSVPAAWIIMVVFFSFYGIFAKSQNLLSSVGASIRLLRYALPPLGWFSMLAFFISQGMDTIWRMAPATSWMAVVGILGHAFVSTSLLAASFIYYRDLSIWVEAALKFFSQSKSSVKA